MGQSAPYPAGASGQFPPQPTGQFTPPQPTAQYPPPQATVQYPPSQLAGQYPPSQPTGQGLYPTQSAGAQYPFQPAASYPPQSAGQYPFQQATQYPLQQGSQFFPQSGSQHPSQQTGQYPQAQYPPGQYSQTGSLPSGQYPGPGQYGFGAVNQYPSLQNPENPATSYPASTNQYAGQQPAGYYPNQSTNNGFNPSWSDATNVGRVPPENSAYLATVQQNNAANSTPQMQNNKTDSTGGSRSKKAKTAVAPPRPDKMDSKHNVGHGGDSKKSVTAAPVTAGVAGEVQKIINEVRGLEEAVDTFNGAKGDKRYAYIEEMLTRLLIRLDQINSDGKEDIRVMRRDAVKEVQSTLDRLELKAM